MGPMGNGGTWGMGHMGNRAQGVWGTRVWAMGYRGIVAMGNGAQWVWGTRGMGHMGNGSHGQWGTGVCGIWAMRPTGGMGYKGMGHVGNMGTGGMGYKGYGPFGQWDTWVMGYRGMGHMGKGAHGQFAPKISKVSSCQKDVKLSKKCQMSKNQTPRLWRRFTKKLN